MPSRSNAETAAPAILAAAFAAAADAPRIVVDGRSGAGKSTLTAALHRLRPDLQVVALDMIYPGWDGLRAGADAAVSGVLAPHARGDAGRWQRWDWERDAPAEWHEVDAARPLVVEGSGILTPASAALAHVRVWVEAPDDVRRERALARDGETYAPHWERWAAQELEHDELHRPRTWASVVVAAD